MSVRATCPDAGCGRRIPLPPRHLLSLCANTSTRSPGRMFRYSARRSVGRTPVRSAHARLRLVGSLDDRPQREPHVAPGASFLIKGGLTVCCANHGKYGRTGPVAKKSWSQGSPSATPKLIRAAEKGDQVITRDGNPVAILRGATSTTHDGSTRRNGGSGALRALRKAQADTRAGRVYAYEDIFGRSPLRRLTNGGHRR
jgi:antitoxin (DNA-binding transcriptional repressor) of toxin-antitoxin stability system